MQNQRARLWLAALLMALGGGDAYAFHSGGVAECGGCHSMHSPAADGSYLLVATTQSDTCLTCHGEPGQRSYHIATPDADLGEGIAPYNLTPGGDFGWLKKTYTFVQRGSTITDAGQNFGHNVMASEHGFIADSDNPSTAPGGSFPADQLHCSSCHDPHGRYRRLAGSEAIVLSGAPIKTSGSYNTSGNEPDAAGAVGTYRILAGNGYAPRSLGAAIGFPGVPPAKVPSDYNRAETAGSVRAAYGYVSAAGNTAWGRWCGACHPNMHSSGAYVHPTDQNLGSRIKSAYDRYVMSGRMNGTNATAYTSLVPFVKDGTGNTYANLAAVSATTTGPVTSDQVTCMSCHRAHASGWDYMLRWNMEGEFIVYDSLYPGTDNAASSFARGRTSTETQKAYYDRPVTAFATYQRVLCNKCHAKD